MPEYSGPMNANPTPKSNEAGIVLYGYVPSIAVGGAGIACFTVLFIVHAVLIFRRRTTRIFQGLMAIGCEIALVGYGLRIASHGSPFVINHYLMQYFTIVSAPVCISAGLYLALSYILKRTNDARRYSPLAPGAIVTVFISADILTTTVQILGAALAGLAASKESKQQDFFIKSNNANHILLAGLCVQTVTSAAFLALLALIIYRLHTLSSTQAPYSPSSLPSPAKLSARPPALLLVILFTSFALFFVRTVFRLAQTAQGLFGTLSSDEAYFIGFELVPVAVTAALWVAYPLMKGLEKMEEGSEPLGEEVELVGSRA